MAASQPVAQQVRQQPAKAVRKTSLGYFQRLKYSWVINNFWAQLLTSNGPRQLDSPVFTLENDDSAEWFLRLSRPQDPSNDAEAELMVFLDRCDTISARAKVKLEIVNEHMRTGFVLREDDEVYEFKPGGMGIGAILSEWLLPVNMANNERLMINCELSVLVDMDAVISSNLMQSVVPNSMLQEDDTLYDPEEFSDGIGLLMMIESCFTSILGNRSSCFSAVVQWPIRQADGSKSVARSSERLGFIRRRLETALETDLENKLVCDNACDFLIIVHMLELLADRSNNCRRTKSAIIRFIYENNVLQTDAWRDLARNYPVLADEAMKQVGGGIPAEESAFRIAVACLFDWLSGLSKTTDTGLILACAMIVAYFVCMP